ncbi:unnamed protein product, partial [Medioppia subpectinata]
MRLFGDCRSLFARPPQSSPSATTTTTGAVTADTSTPTTTRKGTKGTVITTEKLDNSTDKLIQRIFAKQMDTNEFRRRGKQMVDYIADYLETISQRRVTPDVEPGYLKDFLPDSAPKRSEDWDKIMIDFEKYIMPGVTHWQHPRFHAYFPAGNSYPSILADMLSDGIGCVGFSWAASPACTELEIIMLDWMGKMIGLPKEFLCLSDHKSKGGGVIQ